jgi:hypothetical protein
MQRIPSSATLRFAPLGIATAIIADDPALLNAAVANFVELTECPGCEPADIVIRLRRNPFSTTSVGFAVTAKGSRLTIEGEGVDGWADAESRTAECSLPILPAGESRLFAEIGETLLLFLLTRAGRAPVHAASVLIGRTAVLLAGTSGTGKSSLALAAQRQGLEVLSEDTTYVQLSPQLQVWGWPGAIHLDAGSSPPGVFPQRGRGGRLKSAVARIALHRPVADAALVAMKRGSRAMLEQVEPAALLGEFSTAEPGFDLVREQTGEAIAAIASRGAWRLTLSSSPDEAISLLRVRFAQL